jgi:hypothetical protein
MEEKNATLLAYFYLLSKSINEYGRILCLLHEKLKAWWKFFPKKLSEHARLLGTSEYGFFLCVAFYLNYRMLRYLQKFKDCRVQTYLLSVFTKLYTK